MKRLRLKVSDQDRALVLSQGATRQRFKPFAQSFGPTKRASEANAALIVKAVNCHNHLILAMQTILRTTQRPTNGNGQRLQTRLALISRYAATAIREVNHG